MKNKISRPGRVSLGLIIIVIILIALGIGGFFVYKYVLQPEPTSTGEESKDISLKAKEICEKAGGDLCEEYEICPNTPPLNLNETGRCCSNNCSGPTQYEFSTKRHCEINPQTKTLTLCHCEPNENKNKVAVIIAKNGIYDTQEINSQILQYYESVKTDLNIENAGLQKFEGATIAELESFIDSLYINSDIGYIVLVGDDLPVAVLPKEAPQPPKDGIVPETKTSYNLDNLFAIHEKLEYVNRDKRECVYKSECFENCKDAAISFILPPDLYSSTEKADFIVKVLQTYTNYHNNFPTLISKYQKSVLHAYDPKILNADQTSYDISAVKISNTEDEQITNELKNRPIILSLYMHGNETNIGLGRYKTIEDFSNFVKENGTPALFVDSHACQSVALKMENERYCCWPQFYMESGVWAYYIMTESGGNEVRKIFPHEQNFGMAIRKNIIDQNFIFGDILAHAK